MKVTLAILTLALFPGLFTTPTQLAAENAQASIDQKPIEDAVTQFYVALNAMFRGEIEPMIEVWSHEDDVTYMGPGGGLRSGWGQVRADWEKQASLKLGGEVKTSDIHFFVGEELAFVQNYEIGENIDENGKAVQVKIRATNIFRKKDGDWKMISHHTDLLPYLTD